MITIYKYSIPTYGDVYWPLPEAAQIVHVGQQEGDVKIWVLLDTQAPTVPRRFLAVDTGESIHGEGYRYLGTAHLPNGLVHHVLELAS